MTVAAINDYLFLWQLPLILLYVAAWLAGGPFLTRRALVKIANLPRNKSKLANAARINLLGQGSAMGAMVLVCGSLALLGSKQGMPWLFPIALVAGLAAMLLMAWATHWAMLDLPLGKILRIIATTTLPLLALAGALGLGAAFPARSMRLAKLDRDVCRRQLQSLHDPLEAYALRHPGQQAPSLQKLIDGNVIPQELVICPGRRGQAVGYLYAPTQGAARGMRTKTIRVCDRRGNHGNIRLALFTDGHIEELREKDFQALLQLPENREMAKVAAAEP